MMTSVFNKADVALNGLNNTGIAIANVNAELVDVKTDCVMKFLM